MALDNSAITKLLLTLYLVKRDDQTGKAVRGNLQQFSLPTGGKQDHLLISGCGILAP